MSKQPRFEIVKKEGVWSSFAGQRVGTHWHARFVAANGQVVWTTETYRRRRAALHAISLITGHAVRDYEQTGLLEVMHDGLGLLLEVREVTA